MPLDIGTEILVLGIAYLLGSIPFGLFVTWLYGLEDPRNQGSGNIGATNVLRLGQRGPAIVTLILDALKGVVAVLFTAYFAPSLTHLSAVFAVLGHIFPLWLGFKGGKGVATAFGAILVLSPPLAITCLVTWIMVFAATQYSSLAALAAIILSPLYTILLSRSDLVGTCLILALLMAWTHRHNIQRLLKGKETKIGKSSSKDSSKDR
jgi:glycerol-3-phosphate acyltransferase PlsY